MSRSLLRLNCEQTIPLEVCLYNNTSPILFSHGVQSLASPLQVLVVPTSSHPPVVTASHLSLNYTENSELNVLGGVRLTDEDQTCSVPFIIGARLEITSEAVNNDQGILMVGKSVSHDQMF